MVEYAIETKNLTKKFGDFTAVDNLNLKIRKGEIFGYLGPNGSGKTTTTRMLAGILTPTSGTAIVADIDVTLNPEAVKPKIGYMPQKFGLYRDLTVYENLDFYGSIQSIPKQKRKEKIEELLDIVKLADFEDRLVGNLSGGMENRLSLATTLIHDPEILLLDEPTAGIDPPLRKAFWGLFSELNKKGTTILVTTHYMDESEYCDRLGMLSRGKLVGVGTPNEIRRKTYGGDVIEIHIPESVKFMEEVLNDIVEKYDEVFSIFNLRKINEKETIANLIVDNADLVIPRLYRFFEDNKITNFSTKKVLVSLEDAFIKFTEE